MIKLKLFKMKEFICEEDLICEFVIKIHRREKEELHLDDAFYAYGGGVPDYNYEMEILQSSLSDEEIRAKNSTFTLLMERNMFAIQYNKNSEGG